MAKIVKAKKGDSLCNIAFAHGFGDCTQLRAEPKNAYIINRTDDPCQLKPGDVVTLPETKIKEVNAATEKKHKFVKHGTLAMLRFVHGSASPKLQNDASLTFLNVSNFITNLAGNPDGQPLTTFPAAAGFNADADKDIDAFMVEVFDLNEPAGTVKIDLEVLRPTYNAVGKVTGHGPFPGAIIADRKLNPDAAKQGATHRFRTPYLRLVVDDADKKAAPAQTLLASDMHDAGDSKVEILDQAVKGSYTIKSCKQNPKCKSMVTLPIGRDRRRIRLAVHVFRESPGGALIVPLADAERRVWTWFRRVYAQVNIGPKLAQATRAVDPPENLVAIANDAGLTAAGDGTVGFTINAAGKTSQVVGPITPGAGDKPITTALALANLVKSPYKAVVSENPARFVDPVGAKSADIVITEETGVRVTISDPLKNDSRQKLVVGRVKSLDIESWAVPDGNNNWNAGSLQQRTALKNLDTGDDRVDIFVVQQMTGGNRGEAMMSNHRIDPQRRSITKIKWSAFLRASTMDSSNKNPFSFPHEVGHVTAEVVHAKGAAGQLMTSGTSVKSEVDATKRIRDGTVTYDGPAGDFDINARLRSEGLPLLELW
jgi:hypothetical protein